MDLRNKQITVGELLDNPKSKAVFQRRFGRFMKHPMVSAARTLSLDQLAEMALRQFALSDLKNILQFSFVMGCLLPGFRLK